MPLTPCGSAPYPKLPQATSKWTLSERPSVRRGTPTGSAGRAPGAWPRPVPTGAIGRASPWRNTPHRRRRGVTGKFGGGDFKGGWRLAGLSKGSPARQFTGERMPGAYFI